MFPLPQLLTPTLQPSRCISSCTWDASRSYICDAWAVAQAVGSSSHTCDALSDCLSRTCMCRPLWRLMHMYIWCPEQFYKQPYMWLLEPSYMHVSTHSNMMPYAYVHVMPRAVLQAAIHVIPWAVAHACIYITTKYDAVIHVMSWAVVQAMHSAVIDVMPARAHHTVSDGSALQFNHSQESCDLSCKAHSHHAPKWAHFG